MIGIGMTLSRRGRSPGTPNTEDLLRRRMGAEHGDQQDHRQQQVVDGEPASTKRRGTITAIHSSDRM